MTREEAQILGVSGSDDARSMRDMVMRLLGAFEQHVLDEQEWQALALAELRGMPILMDVKIDACRDKTAPQVRRAIRHAEEAEIRSDISKTSWSVLARIITTMAAFSALCFGTYELLIR